MSMEKFTSLDGIDFFVDTSEIACIYPIRLAFTIDSSKEILGCELILKSGNKLEVLNLAEDVYKLVKGVEK